MAVILTVGFADGGYAPQAWRWATVAFSCLAAAALLVRDSVRINRHEFVAILGLSALAFWMLVSKSWSVEPALAAPEAERCLLYLAALIAVCASLEAETAGPFLIGLLAGITFLSAWSLADYYLTPQNPAYNGLLVGPLRYANASSAIAAIGIVLALGLLRAAKAVIPRVLLVATLLVLGPVLILTQSWGGWLALLAGVSVIAVSSERPRHGNKILAATAFFSVAVAIGLLWAVSPHVIHGLTANPRWSYWHAALDDFVAHPELGSGAGTYGAYWAQHPLLHSGVLDAHSLYLESLAELGPLGLAFIVAFFAAAFSTTRQQLRSPAAVACAAFAAYAVHTGIDWDWELPSVTLCGVLAAGVLLATNRPVEARSLALVRRLGLIGLALTIGVVALLRLKTG
jgi:O-antigen ligase